MSAAADPRPLDRLQRWFQAVIMHPDGVAAGVSTPDAQAEIAIAPHQLESVVLPSRQVSGAGRLAVYANAYFARLAECLQEEYPTLYKTLGDEAFTAFVVGYLQAHPSHSYNLSQLGADFPDFLAATRPAGQDGEPETDWAAFLIDLARLERLYGEVFDGPGDEGRRTLQVDELEAVPSEQRADAALVPIASLRMIELGFPAHEYVSAMRRGEDPPIPKREPTRLIVWRRDFVVRRQAVGPEEFLLLQSLIDGRSIVASIARTAALPGGNERLETDLRGWFADWAAAGFFCRIQLAQARN